MTTALFGDFLPALKTTIPGPESTALIEVLARHECPGVTARRARRAIAIGAADDDPIVWQRALGANVEDVDGNIFVDMTAGFAVALFGHRHPAVTTAIHHTTDRLLHAMGDAFPDSARIALLEALAHIAPSGPTGPLQVAMLGLSGSDAVDLAVRTALLATKRPGIIVFDGAYHGLSLGVLGLQAYKDSFASPFRDILHPHVHVCRFGGDLSDVDALLQRDDIGLVLVEPIQGRGGMRSAPPGWLLDLATRARNHGALVAFDEIQTGLGRCGSLWAGPEQGVAPDLLCTGKALGGGVPISACLGSRPLMNAWGASAGEAIATQTFLGHPVGCAAGLAVLEILQSQTTLPCLQSKGENLVDALHSAGFTTRGAGLMLGVELGTQALRVSRALLARGWIALPAGKQAEVLALTPPLTLTQAQISAFVQTLAEVA